MFPAERKDMHSLSSSKKYFIILSFLRGFFLFFYLQIKRYFKKSVNSSLALKKCNILSRTSKTAK